LIPIKYQIKDSNIISKLYQATSNSSLNGMHNISMVPVVQNPALPVYHLVQNLNGKLHLHLPHLGRNPPHSPSQFCHCNKNSFHHQPWPNIPIYVTILC